MECSEQQNKRGKIIIYDKRLEKLSFAIACELSMKFILQSASDGLPIGATELQHPQISVQKF